MINATITGDTVSFEAFTDVFEITGDGYVITFNPGFNGFGVLLKIDTNLVSRVYGGLNTGNPVYHADIIIATGFTGIRAAETAYSLGCIIAASGTIYVYNGTDISVVLHTTFSVE